MPDGPLFSDEPPDSPTASCRQAGKKSSKGWDVPCVLKILCAKDKHVVKDLPKFTIKKFDKITFLDQHFDGTKWYTDPFEAGGTALGTEVTILSGRTCQEAATTMYHEWVHTTQPASMDRCDAEREAYFKTEEWTIERQQSVDPGLDGQGHGALRKPVLTPDGLTFEPNKDAIEKVVKKYPGCSAPSTTPRPVGHDPKKNMTKVRDPVTGKESWRPSQHCDRIDGKRVTVPEKPVIVPKKSWKCPP